MSCSPSSTSSTFEFGRMNELEDDLRRTRFNLTYKEQLYKAAGSVKYKDHTVFGEFNDIKKDAEEALGHIVSRTVDVHKLNLIIQRYRGLLAAGPGIAYLRALRVLQEAHRREAEVGMKLRSYVYSHQSDLVDDEEQMREEGIWPAYADESPFWLALGSACQTFLQHFIDHSTRGVRPEAVLLWRYARELMQIDDIKPEDFPQQQKRYAPALLVMALSISGRNMIRDIKILQTVVRARPAEEGSNPRDFFNLPYDFLSRKRGLRNAIAAVAGKYGTLLGFEKDLNLSSRPSAFRPHSRQGGIESSFSSTSPFSRCRV